MPTFVTACHGPGNKTHSANGPRSRHSEQICLGDERHDSTGCEKRQKTPHQTEHCTQQKTRKNSQATHQQASKKGYSQSPKSFL